MIKFFKEINGDYLAVNMATNDYYLKQGKDHFEGRATAIAGMVASVCTTAISRGFLKQCQRIPKTQVPTEWQSAIGQLYQ